MASMVEHVLYVHATYIKWWFDVRRIAPREKFFRLCLVIGRQFNYPTAMEAALKLARLSL